ncbi:MAG: homoserine dehydrogenase [Alphaproteobacteria bacterium]|nr:homoserine dehydrogenase [Alphaproteobacteria bacterium]MBU0796616.1 homoserine dehydrogenase [Alphaproteobacteria bacterium]MBU0886503.1 homoserine dehydrogenase [Alphaproteobacteria bacterium]MBU1814091.1 homoserine dehydrogenase [Alphaproteobacteria bacterium]
MNNSNGLSSPASGVLRVGIAGLGTVGGGVAKLLASQAELLTARCGREIRVTAVSARDRERDRGVDLSNLRWHADARDLASDPEVDVVIELIGGSDGVARDLIERAIAAGKPVVTANKALLALHGTALARMAEAAGTPLGYEAAVAGGIPVIKALREGLAANGIRRVYGILNGTCNYILTTMRETGREFADVLSDAQKMGYAEADPSFDVDGIDAAHKLAILTSVAFGRELDFKGIHVEGIRHVSSLDLQFAEQLGYRIKLLGIAGVTDHGIEQRVHPCMVPLAAPIAHVEGVFNAVFADGDAVGNVLLTGRGAGEGPTASAVVADLMDIARGHRAPVLGVPADRLAPAGTAPMGRHRGAYYIRLMVRDQPGVIADVAAAFRDNKVSMESVLQQARDPAEAVPVVITTHETEEAGMMQAIARIAALDAVQEPPRLIRIEAL